MRQEVTRTAHSITGIRPIATCAPALDPALLQMSPRYPYDTLRLCYYDRPYNAHHVEQELGIASFGRGTRALPYSNDFFEEVMQRFAVRVEEAAEQDQLFDTENSVKAAGLNHDKYLEYVDWQLHRDARLNWERSHPRVEQLPDGKQ
ncbi:MAG: hypothetical protein R3E01_09445 [Pirellulaceae bacterium]